MDRVPKNPSDSITISLLTLLTNISFKTYVAGVSPKLGYLTLLDVYVLGCLSVSTVQVALHGVFMLLEVSPGLEDGSEVGFGTRELFIWGLVGAWFLFHLWYMVVIRRAVAPRFRAASTTAIAVNQQKKIGRIY